MDLVVGQEDAAVSDYVMRDVGAVVNGAVVADVAGDDPRAGEAHGGSQVVVLEHGPLEPADAHEARELAVLHELGHEGVRHPEEIPIAAAIGVLDEGLDLVGTEAAIGARLAAEALDRIGGLDVADAILVLAWLEELGRHEAHAVFLFAEHLDIVHIG